MFFKNFIHSLIFVVIFFIPGYIYSSIQTSLELNYTSSSGNSTYHHKQNFQENSLGHVSWNDTTISILSTTPITPCNNIVEINRHNGYIHFSYKLLKKWDDENVNVYLIPWPKTFLDQDLERTSPIKPIEGNKQSFISTHKFTVTKRDPPLFGIDKRKKRVNRTYGYFKSQQYTNQIFDENEEVHIYYNNNYMIICYNKEGFEITNIQALNGFHLSFKERIDMHNANLSLYSWLIEDGAPLKLKVNDKDYILKLKSNNELNITDSKDISNETNDDAETLLKKTHPLEPIAVKVNTESQNGVLPETVLNPNANNSDATWNTTTDSSEKLNSMTKENAHFEKEKKENSQNYTHMKIAKIGLLAIIMSVVFYVVFKKFQLQKKMGAFF
jgi:hypothetical protein